MRKTPRGRNVSPPSTGKRVLRLAPETVRTLATDELPQAIGGSCPTTSWPTDSAPKI